MWIEDLKRQIIERHQLERIANPERDKEMERRLAQGIRDLPVSKFLQQIQYMEKELLPAVERRKGKDSEDYKFFASVCSSLVYAIILCDRYEYLENKLTSEHLLVQVLKDRQAMVEKELSRYCTMEDLYFSNFLDRYAEATAERAKSMLERKK
jgi:hypothetical protein